MLWAVANTLTVFAIRDVGLTIAFPLWNANSLVGIFWGWLLFGELRGASPRNLAKVLLGAVAILAAAIMLGFSTLQADTAAHTHHALSGILAAAGASLLWGTMYVPYRKAYISGMSPLSFVTVFTIGELVTCFALVLALDGGTRAPIFHSPEIRHVLFWLFLGGFVWVIGDIFQQYACKYLGIGRGIPLANTNQLWGLAWGALVFGELAHADWPHRLLVLFGSLIMIAGALAVSTAIASAKENASTNAALLRECTRYGLDYDRVLAAQSGIAHQNPTIHPGTTSQPAEIPRRVEAMSQTTISQRAENLPAANVMSQGTTSQPAEIPRRVEAMSQTTISPRAENLPAANVMSQGTASQPAEIPRRVEAMSQTTISPRAENLPAAKVMSQGTTSVVPRTTENDVGFSPCAKTDTPKTPSPQSPFDRRRWWDYLIVAIAAGFFVWLGLQARVPTMLAMNFTWLAVLSAVLAASALAAGYSVWKANRFS